MDVVAGLGERRRPGEGAHGGGPGVVGGQGVGDGVARDVGEVVGAGPQTVAKRAGHTVAVLLRVYAKFIDDSDDATNAKITAYGNRRS
ncbi:hypothetical protein [Streptomyces sp. PT12]|uniref:hypothetical protein n=1 Tax=Streptomyces sp. PT12 TaxID=1510197 RepID=UPI000DE33176|nr:hypothetical protein [Streptomyces sp. PT12]RBM06836.1 hypothetical protein DEH69_25545 [Streptomyces sp. PT12]